MLRWNYDFHPIRLLLPHPPEGVPPVFWRRARPLRWLMLLVALPVLPVVAAILSPDTALRRVPELWMIPYSAAFCSGSVAVLVAWLARRTKLRLRAQVRDDGYERCLECGYSLRGLPVRHRCPECGKTYELNHVRWAWVRLLGDQPPSDSGPAPLRLCVGCGHDVTLVEFPTCPQCGSAVGFDGTWEDLGVTPDELERLRAEHERRGRSPGGS